MNKKTAFFLYFLFIFFLLLLHFHDDIPVNKQIDHRFKNKMHSQKMSFNQTVFQPKKNRHRFFCLIQSLHQLLQTP